VGCPRCEYSNEAVVLPLRPEAIGHAMNAATPLRQIWPSSLIPWCQLRLLFAPSHQGAAFVYDQIFELGRFRSCPAREKKEKGSFNGRTSSRWADGLVRYHRRRAPAPSTRSISRGLPRNHDDRNACCADSRRNILHTSRQSTAGSSDRETIRLGKAREPFKASAPLGGSYYLEAAA